MIAQMEQMPQVLTVHGGKTSYEVVPRLAIPEPLRSQIISNVVTNDNARGALPQPFAQQVLAEEFLLRNLKMSVPSEVENRGALTPEYGRRSALLYRGEIPVADKFVYGAILGKGGGLSGRLYKRWIPPKSDYKETPFGMFGSKEAENERVISNILLESGFRAGLVVGYVVMEPEPLRNWLVPLWEKHDPERAALIHNAINLIKENGDKPCFEIRVTGSPERWQWYEDWDKEVDNFKYINRRKKELSLAAELLRREAQIFPHFKTYINQGLIGNHDVIDTLSRISNMSPLEYHDPDVYSKLLVGIISQNVLGLKRAASILNSRNIHFEQLAESLTNTTKDIDFAFVTQDFEEAHRTQQQSAFTGNVPDIYRDRIIKLVANRFDPEILPLLPVGNRTLHFTSEYLLSLLRACSESLN